MEPRSAVVAAYQRHAACRADRDWRGLADCFAADARYFDPIFGWYEGREAIRDFLGTAMAGLGERVFTDVWHVIDGERLVLYWRCGLPGEPPPESGDRLYHGMSALVYAGQGLWQEQMDIYDRDQARSSRSQVSTSDAGAQSTT